MLKNNDKNMVRKAYEKDTANSVVRVNSVSMLPSYAYPGSWILLGFFLKFVFDHIDIFDD